MRPIQAILCLLFFLLTIFCFNRVRSLLLDRVVVIALGITAMVFAIFPNITTRLANTMGVGRGVDLITYLILVMLSYICALLYSKLRSLEKKLTDVARAQAIDGASNKKFKK